MGKLLSVAAALLAFGGLTATEAAAAETCAPMSRGQAAATVDKVLSAETGRLDGRLLRTTYLRGGVYRTTRCDDSGAPQREVVMAPQRLPDGTIEHLPVETTERTGSMLRVASATRGDLSTYRGDWRAAVKAATRAGLPPLDRGAVSAVTPPRATHSRTATKRGPLARAAGYGNQCTLEVFNWYGGSWAPSPGFIYSTNFSAIGAPYVADFVSQTLSGFQTWNFRFNLCGWPQSVVVPIGHAGATGLTAADATGAVASWNSGTNVVDAGALTAGACAGAVGCAWRWKPTSGPQYFSQANIRINTSYAYAAGAQPGHFDIWTLMAHEGGHAIVDAADLYDPLWSWAVMYGYINTNDITKRWLSKGEYDMVTAIY